MKWNESALTLSAFENRLRAGLAYHTMQTNQTAVEQNKNIKWFESRGISPAGPIDTFIDLNL